MIVKLLTEHHLELLSLKGGCSGSSESTLVKMPHCWKSHATAHFSNIVSEYDPEMPESQPADKPVPQRGRARFKVGFLKNL